MLVDGPADEEGKERGGLTDGMVEDLRAKSEDEQDVGEAERRHDCRCLFFLKFEDIEAVTWCFHRFEC